MDANKPSDSVRVATWNLARSGGTDRTDMLAAERVELLCAQEVTARAHEHVLSSGVFDWGLLSLHHLGGARPANLKEGLGVAVYGRSPIRVRASGILPDAARPEKMLFVEVELPGWGHPVAVVSYHAAPGDGKPVNTLQVAHWLELRAGPTIVGLDANSPRIDHPDHEHSVFHWTQAPFTHMEPALIGPPSQRRHRLDDALRRRLADHPEEAAPLSDAGPLAVTYDREKNPAEFAPSRFDSLWVTPEFGVGPVRHLWDHTAGRPFGGSDHAMVVTDLEPSIGPRHPNELIVSHLRRCHALADGTALELNVANLADEHDRTAVSEWLADGDRALVTWSPDGPRELYWAHDRAHHTISGLAATICRGAGVALPRKPAGPHWWLDPTKRTLAQISFGE